MNFKLWLETNGIHYLDIGHDDNGNYNAWYIKNNSDNIEYAHKNPDFIHDDIENINFKGRIDHDKQVISVVYHDGIERIDYIVRLLTMDYPNFQIYYFGYGLPQKLT